MNPNEYYNYTNALVTKRLSLNGLRRIVMHDRASGWSETPDGRARRQVILDCSDGKIPFKEDDDPGDEVYGIGWPLPLTF